MAAITHAKFAADMLRNAAQYYRTIAAQNPPLKIQMDELAVVYDKVADLVEHDPTGVIDER